MFTFFYIFVYTYTCNGMRFVMLQINEYDDMMMYTVIYNEQPATQDSDNTRFSTGE